MIELEIISPLEKISRVNAPSTRHSFYETKCVAKMLCVTILRIHFPCFVFVIHNSVSVSLRSKIYRERSFLILGGTASCLWTCTAQRNRGLILPRLRMQCGDSAFISFVRSFFRSHLGWLLTRMDCPTRVRSEWFEISLNCAFRAISRSGRSRFLCHLACYLRRLHG